MNSLLDFDEINKGFNTLIDEGMSPEKALESVMIDSLARGIEQTRLDLSDDTLPDATIDELHEILFMRIGGKTFADRAKEEQTPDELLRLVNTETHRVFVAGQELAAKKAEGTVMKEWVDKDDNRVRDTHAYLHRVRVPVDEKFYTFDGDSTYKPGGFGLACNNVNCRCVLKIIRV